MKTFVLLLINILLFAATIATAEDYNLQGRIIDDAGKPIKGAGIKLKLGVNTISYVYTGDDGQFAFSSSG